MTLQTNFYFLSPVEVVKVTPKNIEEVAAWCGGQVSETESRRVEGRMDKYVWVPTPKGSAISWAFPGMYITKRVVITENNELKVTYSVFRKAYFKANYFQSPDIAVQETWDRQQKEAGKKTHPSATPADMKAQLRVQLVNDQTGEVVSSLELPETEVNGQGSMVAQREAIHESFAEQIANSGGPHRA